MKCSVHLKREVLFMDLKLFEVLFIVQKINIFSYRLNKLSMKIFVEFLKSEFVKDIFYLPIEQKENI